LDEPEAFILPTPTRIAGEHADFELLRQCSELLLE
jgi:hypothetical protein